MHRQKVFWGLCLALFVAACLGMLVLYAHFCRVDTPLLGYVEWTKCHIGSGEGDWRPFDLTQPAPWDWQPGEMLRLSVRLPDRQEMPRLYEDGYILMECGDMDLALLLDDEPLLQITDGAAADSARQLQLPLTAQDAGRRLTALCRPYTPLACQAIVLARYSSNSLQEAFSISSTIYFALPAGAFLLGFLVILALFLMGVCLGAPNYSLPALAAVTLLSALWRLAAGTGVYFLPPWLSSLLTSEYVPLALILLTVLYLLLNRRRAFWQWMAMAGALTLTVLAVCCALSRLFGGRLHSVMDSVFTAALQGRPAGLLYYLASWMALAGGAVSAGILLHDLIRVRREKDAAALTARLAAENYQNMASTVQGTSVLRHEWKNQVAALHLLADSGDLEGLKTALGRLDHQLDTLSDRQYCAHFAINIILRNAAARALRQGVAFSATAPLPAQLPVDESDLCTLLINMLDNALAAAQDAPEKERQIVVSLKVSQGFLAIRCENGYAGVIVQDADGRLHREGAVRAEGHGFGLGQMQAIAKKYGGILDVSFTPQRFVVQTALVLQKKKA